MRYLSYGSLWLLLVTSLLLLLAACTSSPTPTATATVASAPADITVVDESGNTSIDLTSLPTVLGTVTPAVLSQTESNGLAYMREEEKLARDVYVKLYEKWNLPIFKNISESEQTHTDAVKSLLDRYGLQDPAAGRDIGEFADVTLRNLYDKLIGQGMQSLSDALEVGAAIEEIDILDLEERIAQTNKADIILVYENLMKGSRNHLRSFVSTLKTQTGETYVPQHLTSSVYQSIVGAPIEKGGRGTK